MERYIRFVIARRVPVLILFALVTALSLYSMSQGKISSSIDNMFLGGTPQYKKYVERTRQFSNDMLIAVAFESDNPLAPGEIERLQATVGEIGELPSVSRVLSLLDARAVKVDSGFISFESYAEQALADPSESDGLIEELAADPFAGGLLLSEDGKHVAVIVEFLPAADENGGDTSGGGADESGMALDGESMEYRAEDAEIYVGQVLDIFEKHGYDRSELHYYGMLAVLAGIMKETYFNITRLFPVVVLVLLLAVFVMYRRLWPVAITGAVSFLGVVWMMGFSVALFTRVNVIMAATPGIIMIVAFSDVIHLVSSYLLELESGKDKEEAIIKSCTEVGTACLYTSLTTFAGFISMALVPAPIFRQTGITLGFGVAVSLLVAMTLTPIIFWMTPKPKAWRTGAASSSQDRLDRALAAISGLTLKRPWPVVAAFALLLAVSAYGISNIHIETKLVDRLGEDSQLRRDEIYFQQHFAGTNFVDVFIKADEKDGLERPETLRKVYDFQKEVEKIEGVGRALSAVDMINAMHKEFRPEEAARDPVPAERDHIAQYLFFMEDEADFESFMDADRRLMRVAVRLTDDGFASTKTAGEEILKRADMTIGPMAPGSGGTVGDIAGGPGVESVEVSGLTYLLGEWLITILDGQRRGLLFALATILVMMAVALRSIKAGLWSMIPNVIPLLALGGYCGLAYEKIDSDALMVALVAIGIGVDDTIHFLMRFRFEQARDPDRAAAADRTFHYSGRAIIITTIILTAGFMPFAISSYQTVDMLGTLLPGCLIVALLADLMLVPALASLGAFNFAKKNGGPRTSEEAPPNGNGAP